MQATNVDRRDFLMTSAAGTAAAPGTAARAPRPASRERGRGANGRVGVAFLGVGGRGQQHVDVVLRMQKENKGVAPVAVCDVWDGDPKLGRGSGRGLYPTAKRC